MPRAPPAGRRWPGASGPRRPSPGWPPGPRRISRGTTPSIIGRPRDGVERRIGHRRHTSRRPRCRAPERVERRGRGRRVGDEDVDLVEAEHVARGDLLELGGIREDDDRAGHAAQGPVGEDLRHGVVHQALLRVDRADAHEQGVRAQLMRGELGQVAEHRVHPRPDDAAEDDQLDPLPVDQRVGHVQRVGDHREPAMGDLAGEGERGGAAADGDGRVVLDACRRGAGDGPLRVEVEVAAPGSRGTGRKRGTTIRADQAPLASEALQIAPDRRRGHAQLVRELCDARAPIGPQLLHKPCPAFGIPHARILLARRARCQLLCALCAGRAQKLHAALGDPYDACDGLPAWRRSRSGRV